MGVRFLDEEPASAPAVAAPAKGRVRFLDGAETAGPEATPGGKSFFDHVVDLGRGVATHIPSVTSPIQLGNELAPKLMTSEPVVRNAPAIGMTAFGAASGGNPVAAGAGGVAGEAYREVMDYMKTGKAKNMFDAIVQMGKQGGIGALTQGVGNVAADVGRSVMIGTRAAGTAAAGKTIGEQAAEIGVDLTPAEISGALRWAIPEKFLDNVPTSAGIMQRFKAKQIQALEAARDRLLAEGGATGDAEALGQRIKDLTAEFMEKAQLQKDMALKSLNEQVSSRLGTTQKSTEAGQELQQTFIDRSKAARGVKDAAYQEVGKVIPSDAVIPLNQYKDAIRTQLEREYQVSPANRDTHTIQWLERLSKELQDKKSIMKILSPRGGEISLEGISQKGLEGYNYPTYEATRRRLNEIVRGGDTSLGTQTQGAAFQTSKVAAVARELKRALDNDFGAFSDISGGKIKEAFDTATDVYRTYADTFKNDDVLKIVNRDPERIVESVFRPGGVTDVNRLRTAVGDTIFNKTVKPQIVNKLLEGGVEGLGQKIAQYGPESLKNVFSGDELGQMESFAAGGDVLNKAHVRNKFFTRLLEKQPQTVVNYVIQPGNTENIELIRKHLGEKGVQSLREGVLANLFDTNSHGQYSADIIHRKVTTLGDKTLSALFTPEELGNIKQLADVGYAAQSANRLAGNASGTARNVSAATYYGSLGAMIKSGAYGPAAVTALTPPVLAKMYLSPITRKLVMEGLTLPPGSNQAAAAIARLVVIAKERYQGK